MSRTTFACHKCWRCFQTALLANLHKVRAKIHIYIKLHDLQMLDFLKKLKTKTFFTGSIFWLKSRGSSGTGVPDVSNSLTGKQRGRGKCSVLFLCAVFVMFLRGLRRSSQRVAEILTSTAMNELWLLLRK